MNIEKQFLQKYSEIKFGEEEFFSSLKIFELMQEAVFVFNRSGRTVYLNNTAIIGLGSENAEEVTGRNITHLIHPVDRQQATNIIQTVLKGNPVRKINLQVMTDHDKVITAEINAIPIRNYDEQVFAGLIAARDISDKLNAEYLNANLLNNSIQGTLIIKETGVVYANKAFSELSGFSIEELLNFTYQEFMERIHPDDRLFVEQQLKARLKGDSLSGRYKCRAIDKTGKIKWLEILANRIMYYGTPAVQSAILDIDDIFTAQPHTAACEELLKELLDESNSTCTLIDSDFVILASTNSFNSLFNITNASHRKINLSLFGNDILNTLSTEYSHEFIYTGKKSELIEDISDSEDILPKYKIRISKHRSPFEIGNFLYFLSMEKNDDPDDVKQDIEKLNLELELLRKQASSFLQVDADSADEMIELREELTRTRNELINLLEKEKELSELKSRFISMISHEYRTPLTVILSSTYLIDDYIKLGSYDNALNQLNRVKSSVKALTNLLDDVLSFTRADYEIDSANLMDFNLHDFINEIIDEIFLIDKHRHVIILDSHNKNLVVKTEPQLMRQIFMQLLLNSVKYSPINTLIRVEINVKKKSYELIVRDSGVGISGSEIKSIYEPFYRGKEHVGTVSGTGLGLTIVRRCVNALNGKIDVSSKQGHGTQIRIKFPIEILNQ